VLIVLQTKGKTLEEISIIFGDPVGLTTVGLSGTERQDDEHFECVEKGEDE
jgi:hypothetical protein